MIQRIYVTLLRWGIMLALSYVVWLGYEAVENPWLCTIYLVGYTTVGVPVWSMIDELIKRSFRV